MSAHRKLMWYIFPSYLLILVAALFIVVLYGSSSVKEMYLDNTQTHLEADARLFRTLFQDRIHIQNVQEIDTLCKTFGEQLTTRITVILPSGQVIGDSDEDPANMNNHSDRPEIRDAITANKGTAQRYSHTLKKDMMYVAISAKSEEHIVGIVRASTSISTISKVLSSMNNKIVGGGIVVAFLAAVVSFVVSYRLNKPLEEMKQGAMRFAEGDLRHRVYITGSQEMCSLADSLNRMASQLDERMETVTRQRNELEAVLRSMVEAVLVVDPEERIMRCNQAAGGLFHFNVDTAEQRPIQEVIRNADIQRFVKKTLHSDSPVEDVIVLKSEDELFLRAHGTLLATTANHSAGALLVFHNITRLKQLESMRQEFVANVSHELKTPITSIKGFVETLQDGAIDDADTAARFLDIIARNASRLTSIIEDLLSLSKIEQGEEKGQILLTETGTKDVLSMAISVCENAAQEKDIALQLECAELLRWKVNPPLLEQAVVNLLDNAIKYSEPQSTIHVQAKRQNSGVLMTVSDTGCGIPEEHLPRLFERFYRVDKARSRKLGGTGLGLAIVKHIVQAHHGTITVESTLGEGSTFSITLPMY